MAGRIVQNAPGSERRVNSVGGRIARAALSLALLAPIGAGLAACKPAPPAAASQAAHEPGGPFQLVDTAGRPVDQNLLKGKWSLVFFGYTFCPDFCPTTLTMLGRAMDQLGPDKAAKAQVVFISVDPDRDTPAQLKTYLSSPVFPKNTVGLTGTPAQIAQVAKAYYAIYQKDGTGPNYTVDHSTVIYLMDPSGRFVRPIADGLTPEEVAGQVSEAMRGA
jgi:protein SCO1